ncbi:hypothetical protein [uncultured Bradyrhizobium sp.]|jgi:hypothetical protein|uniref:hypothetical protein n=1 Tax=uncultured Bradyrhizobium sp. TaxID=199684 RepID=UPI00260B5797|nr:hypothetical protein [uncultured Bradyrhizobium sp.]
MKQKLEIRLREARESGLPWHAIGATMREGSLAHSKNPDIWTRAAEATHLSELMLRRYVAALDRLGQIEITHGLAPGELLPPTFAPTELAIRLYGRDPAAGLAALKALKQRKMTLRDIRRELQKAEGFRSTNVAERRHFIESCSEAIALQAPRLFGRGAVAQRRPFGFRCFHPLGFEFQNEQGFVLGGADLYIREFGRDSLDLLAQSALLATYLPSFYIVIGPDLAEGDDKLAITVLDILRANSVGVLLLRDHDDPVVVRRPQVILKPDRVKDYIAISKELAPRPD